MLIWLVVICRSSVMVEVKTALIFPRSICMAKKAKARMGSRMKSILVYVCMSFHAPFTIHHTYLRRTPASSSSQSFTIPWSTSTEESLAVLPGTFSANSSWAMM